MGLWKKEGIYVRSLPQPRPPHSMSPFGLLVFLGLQSKLYFAVRHPPGGTSPRGIPDTPAPTTPADTPAPITPADTPAPTIVTYTAAPVAAANTRAPVAAASTLAPIAAASNTTTPVPATYTPAPSTGAESEEFQGLGIPGDLQDIILADVSSTVHSEQHKY